jgi:hypothetical protein
MYEAVPKTEAAMRTVDLHVNRAGFGESLSDMRSWLDHHGCTPAAFETRTEKPRATVLVHVEFQESDAAEAFELAFEAYTDG